jgi:hypothetical protein
VLFQTDFISVNDQIVKNKVREKRAVGTHALDVKDVESWSGKLEMDLTHSISKEYHCDNTGIGTRHTLFYCKCTIDFDFIIEDISFDGNGTGAISDVEVQVLIKDMEDLSVNCGSVNVVTKDFPVTVSGYRTFIPGTLIFTDSLHFSFFCDIEFGDIENPDGTIGGTFTCTECWKNTPDGVDCDDIIFPINLFPCSIGDPSYSQILYWIILFMEDRFPQKEGVYTGQGTYELSYCDPVIYEFSLTLDKK